MSGTLVIIAVVIILILLLSPYIEALIDDRRANSFVIDEEQKNNKQRSALTFAFKNNTDKELSLNILDLDEKSSEYKFNSSVLDYKMFVEYMKVDLLNVFGVRVNYTHQNWQMDKIILKEFNPFSISERTVFFALSDFETNQYLANIIQNKIAFRLNYFSSLHFKLNPYENKEITLFVSQTEWNEIYHPIQCAVLVKNLTSERQTVKLFDKTFYQDEENQGKFIFESLFETTPYSMLLTPHLGLEAKKIRFYCEKESAITYKLNFDEYKIVSSKFDVDAPLISRCFFEQEFSEIKSIQTFEMSIDPNQEILVAFTV